MATWVIGRHACARCGRLGRADRMVYSPHTGARYCQDWRACDRRAARHQKGAAV
jgi:hypothetical protein